MHSGDLAVIDAEGYGNITGRVKDMVVRGGENVWLAEWVELDESAPAVLEYDARPAEAESECIGAFSRTKARWAGGSRGEDALTWYAAPHRDDFAFRTAMFGGFPAGAARERRVGVRREPPAQLGRRRPARRPRTGSRRKRPSSRRSARRCAGRRRPCAC